MRVALTLALFAACGSSEYPPPNPLPAELIACDISADCVIVELGCCDHCNGGDARAVSRDRVAEVEAQYAERCGANTACTLMGCAALAPECDAGVCVAVPRPL